MRGKLAMTGCVAIACAAQRHAEVPPKRPVATAAPSASVSTSTGGSAPLQASRAKLAPLVSDSWQAFDQMSVDNDTTLYVGSAGQRWLVRTEKAPLPDDPDHERYVLTGASSLAPEALLYVRKRASGYVFVGENGGIYSAKEPLSEFAAARTPPEPVRTAAAGRDAIVILTRRDTVLRTTDDGATYATIKAPSSPLAIAGNSRGEMLFFAAPGHLLGSTDDGATFRPWSTLGIGPSSFVRGADGTLAVRGTALSPTKPPGLAGFSGAYAVVRDGALERVKSSPSAIYRPSNDEDALDFGDLASTGRALYTDDGYLEVQHGESGLVVALLQNDKVTRRALPGTKDCELVSVAGSGAHVVIECVHVVDTPKGTRDDLLFFRSGDHGKTFTADGSAVGGEGTRTIALSPKGTIYATGINEGVMSRAIGIKTFTALKWPRDHTPQKMLVGAEDRLFVVALAPEDVGEVLLTSRDGKTFASKPAPIENVDDTVQLAYENGTFAAFTLGDPVKRYATRDDGATWDTRELPFGAEWVAMAGARGLATGPGGKGYETLDFGLTWGPVPLPRWSSVGGTMPIACAPSSCLLGDVAIRRGWELATAADIKPIVAENKPREHVHQSPLECTVEGDDIELGTVSEPELEPNNALLWSTVSEASNGAIDLVTWPRGAKAITRIPMMPAPKEPAGVRKWTSDDGVIVLRAARGDGKVTADLELAWWVASTNKVHQAKIPHATTSLGKWGTPSGVAAIAPGYGLYLRTANTNEPALYLAKENGPVAKVALKDPFPSVTRVFARRTPKGTLFAAPARESWSTDQSVYLFDLTDAGALTSHAWGLWMGAPNASLAFCGDALTIRTVGNEKLSSRGFVVPWKDAAMETPDAAPFPKDLAACAGTGSRVEIPWTVGARTPIVITRGKSKINHATLATVTRGNCARGILAGQIYLTPGAEWSIVPADDPTHAFSILRKDKTHVLARLQCQKGTTLPPAFNNAPGFFQP